jgi:hypothetical protein
VTHIAKDEATGIGADPPLVFKRWMKVVLVMILPSAGPCCVPIACSKRQPIAPAFGQTGSEPAGIVVCGLAAAHTLLLSKELCQVALAKGSGFGANSVGFVLGLRKWVVKLCGRKMDDQTTPCARMTPRSALPW